MRRLLKYGLVIGCIVMCSAGCNKSEVLSEPVTETTEVMSTEISAEVSDFVVDLEESKDLSDIELLGDFEASKDLVVPDAPEYNVSDEMADELFSIEPTDEKSLEIKDYLTTKYGEDFTIMMTGEEEMSNILIALVSDKSGVTFTATKNLSDNTFMDTYSQHFFKEPISEYVSSVAAGYDNTVYVEIYDTQSTDLREKNFAEITETEGVTMNVGVTISIDDKNGNAADLVKLCDELKTKFGESQFVYTLYNDETGETVWWDIYSGFPTEDDVVAFFA